MDHPENNGRPLVRSQFYLSCESSKRVQTGEPNVKTPGWIRNRALLMAYLLGSVGRRRRKR